MSFRSDTAMMNEAKCADNNAHAEKSRIPYNCLTCSSGRKTIERTVVTCRGAGGAARTQSTI